MTVICMVQNESREQWTLHILANAMNWNKCPIFTNSLSKNSLQRGIGLIVACKEYWKYSSKHLISIASIDMEVPSSHCHNIIKGNWSFSPPLNVQIVYAPESLPGVLVATWNARSQKNHFNRRGSPDVAWLETNLHLCTWFQVPLPQKDG